MSPSLGANSCRNVAERAASTMSPISARLTPAPAATPFTATTTGARNRYQASIIGLKCSRKLAPIFSPRLLLGSPDRSSPMRSAPEQKARPEAVSTTARISGSASIATAAACRSVISARLSAFNRSGRLRVTWAMPSRRSKSKVSNCMIIPMVAVDFTNVYDDDDYAIMRQARQQSLSSAERSMPIPEILRGHLRLPVIGAPMFIVSTPRLVLAQCKAGIVGAFPALNARPAAQLDDWLAQMNEELASFQRANPHLKVAPFA